MKKVMFTLLVVMLMLFLSSGVALADSYSSGAVIIDTAWTINSNNASGTLSEAVADTGVVEYSDITSLVITATDTITVADLATLPLLINLENLYVEDTVTVGDVGDDFLAFHANIKTVTLPTSRLGDDAFSMCSSLQSVLLPKANTIGENSFLACANLNSVSLTNVTQIGDYAFSGCVNLQKVLLPNVITIGIASFVDCSSLERISLPCVLSLGVCAFGGDISLNSVSLPVVTELGAQMFNMCPQHIQLTLGTLPPEIIGSVPLAIPPESHVFPNISIMVEKSYYASYDNDVRDVSPGAVNNDGKWWNGSLSIITQQSHIIAENPKTGDENILIYNKLVFITSILAALIILTFVFVLKRQLKNQP